MFTLPLLMQGFLCLKSPLEIARHIHNKVLEYRQL
jgi:hypothetical protein